MHRLLLLLLMLPRCSCWGQELLLLNRGAGAPAFMLERMIGLVACFCVSGTLTPRLSLGAVTSLVHSVSLCLQPPPNPVLAVFLSTNTIWMASRGPT